MTALLPAVKSRQLYWSVIKQTFKEFMEDKATRLGAALAYYTMFSIAPLLIIAIGLVGWFFGNSADTRIEEQVSALMGEQGAKTIQSMVDAMAQRPKSGMLAVIVGVLTLLVGAAGVFGQLQDALNTIWKVAPKPGRGWRGFVRDRFLSFAMVAGVCFLLLVSLIVSVMIAGMNHFLRGEMPGWPILLTTVNAVVSVAVITLMFSMMYKVLPDVKMPWSDVWMGGFVTAILFTFGKWAIGAYLGRASVGSAYGAAGSLVVVILWIYYAAQIFLMGAEFTQVYSKRIGHRNVPDDNAVALTDEMRANQGIPTDKVLEVNAKSETDIVRQNGKSGRKGIGNGEKPRRVLPVTVGFAVGFLVARRWRVH